MTSLPITLRTGAVASATATRVGWAALMLSPSETRPAPVQARRDISHEAEPPAETRPPWFTRLTLGAIEGERDTRVQRRASHRSRRPEDQRAASARFPWIAAAYAAPVAVATVRVEEPRSTADQSVRSLPAAPPMTRCDIDRERFAIRRLLRRMTGEQHHLERLGRAFEVDEQNAKNLLDNTWRREHWGQPPVRPRSWRID